MEYKRFRLARQEWFRPRLTPLLLASLMVFAFYYFVQSLLTSPILLSYKDDFGYVAKAVKYDVSPHTPAVIAIGSSILREALLPREFIEQQLLMKTGSARQFWNLSAGNLSAIESLAIMNSLSLKQGSTIVVQLSSTRMNFSPEDALTQYTTHRIPFLNYKGTASILKKASYAVPTLPSPYQNRLWMKKIVVANYQTMKAICPSRLSRILHFSVCLSKAIVANSGKYYQPYRYSRKPMTDEQKAGYEKKLYATFLPRYYDAHQFSTAVYESLAQQVIALGHTLIFIDLPKDPRALGIEQLLAVSRQKDIEILKKTGATYINFSEHPDFERDDFYDYYHLVSKGREKFTPLFVSLLSDHIKGTQ